MSPRTAARRLASLRQFHRFLVAEGIRGDDPMSTIDGPKLGRPLPKILEQADVEKLIEAARARGGAEASGSLPCSKFSMRRACASPSW